jgi:hypothetical protein
LVIGPEWLVQLARTKPAFRSLASISEQALARIRPRGPGSSDRYGAAALAREVEMLAGAPAGTRNNALNRAAFRLFQLVAGGLDRDHVIDGLIGACHRNHLIEDDGLRSVTATIQSARAGMKYPRSRSGAA